MAEGLFLPSHVVTPIMRDWRLLRRGGRVGSYVVR